MTTSIPPVTDPIDLSRRLFLALASGGAALAPSFAHAGEPPRDLADDPFFGKAIIDIDETRETPTRHRFVHGQFEGTDTRFLVALPEKGAYAGRLVQFLQGGRGGNEYTGYGRGNQELAFAQGAFYVESNQGHIGNDMSGLKGDTSILNWRASAQAARFARTLATAYYGTAPRHGYVFGGSGGGMRSIDCIEAAPAIWQGAVPFMINRSGLTTFNWSVTAWASAVLAARLPALAAASLEGRDPASVLETDAERAALATLHRAGFPRRAEDQLGPNALWILGMQTALAAAPRYFLEFWTKPGYEGMEGTPEIAALLIDTEAVVEEVLDGNAIAARLAADAASELSGAMRAGFSGNAPRAIRVKTAKGASQFLGASLQFESGAAKGRRALCTGTIGDALSASLDVAAFAGVKAGDTLRINNRVLLAFMYLHRHSVDRRYPGMRQFFDGETPRYAQIGLDFDAIEVPKGAFQGKMILLQHLLDREAMPTSAGPYIEDVRKTFGSSADEHFRVWWIDNAQHGVPADARTRYIDFRGCYSQALVDVMAWVEEGRAPPASTPYRFDETTQVSLPAGAQARCGIQPIVRLSAAGANRVQVGKTIDLVIEVEVPPGAGEVASLALDFDGTGAFSTRLDVPSPGPARLRRVHAHAFAAPGRHVVSVLAGSARGGRHKGYVAFNLARLVVEVSA